jgi:hypothetical protein
MNIFYIHTDPKLCAEWAVDSHCVKMILEASQLLSTAHRLLDGVEYIDKTKTGRNVKRWRLPDDRDGILYSATHVNHPSAVWCRESNNNYTWLWCYLYEHCKEYTYRYGKIHKVDSSGLIEYLRSPPVYIPFGPKTQPPSAMDAKYIISEDAVKNYRNYYKYGKAHLHKWKNREAPEWLKEA